MIVLASAGNNNVHINGLCAYVCWTRCFIHMYIFFCYIVSNFLFFLSTIFFIWIKKKQLAGLILIRKDRDKNLTEITHTFLAINCLFRLQCIVATCNWKYCHFLHYLSLLNVNPQPQIYALGFLYQYGLVCSASYLFLNFVLFVKLYYKFYHAK